MRRVQRGHVAIFYVESGTRRMTHARTRRRQKARRRKKLARWHGLAALREMIAQVQQYYDGLFGLVEQPSAIGAWLGTGPDVVTYDPNTETYTLVYVRTAARRLENITLSFDTQPTQLE